MERPIQGLMVVRHAPLTPKSFDELVFFMNMKRADFQEETGGI